MEKPFDVKDLGEKLKAAGLELAEENVKVLLPIFLDWIEDSVKMTENKFDDFFVVIRPQLEATLNPLIEKINPND